LFLGALDDRDLYGDQPVAWSCVKKSKSESNLPGDGGGVNNTARAKKEVKKRVMKKKKANKLECLLREINPVGRVFGSGLFG
jgi:hypothetical protein